VALLAIILIALGGCQKYDDGALWDEVNSQAERLAALEAWQATLNGNITALQELVNALQTQRYVTNVLEFTAPAPGGYIISFNTGNPVTIKHGATGAKGDTGNEGAQGDAGSTPQIGVAEYPAGSGAYYWTLNGVFIEANGQKLPVAGVKGDPGDPGQPGAPGVTPKLRVNTVTDYWQLCVTGACDVQGDAGWENVLGSDGQPVRAAGVSGANAVFAPGGVDYVNDDYVEFTLADGVTKIQVPKYRPLDITFTPPGAFNHGEVKTINFTVAGYVQSITVADVPRGWTVTPSLAEKTITVTAPAIDAGYYVAAGTVALIVSDGAERTITKPLALECPQYVELDIHFTPRPFAHGATGAITYTATGGATMVSALNIPAGWTVSVTHAGSTGTFTITAPVALSEGEALILVANPSGEVVRPLRLWMSSYPASTQTWTFGNLTWSDAIRVPDCNKTAFVESDTEPQCRSYTSGTVTRYYYNWAYVNANAATLCPSPWIVPSHFDFNALNVVTNAATLGQAWGYGGHADGTNVHPSAYGFYWSSTSGATGYAYALAYVTGGSITPEHFTRRYYGFEVRCVR
jgi:hypothetical protein